MDYHRIPADAPAAPSSSPACVDAGEAWEPPAMAVCDVALVSPFSAGPHAPVLVAFGGDRLHQFESHGRWDLDRAVADAPAGALFRSIRRFNAEKAFYRWDDLTFRHGPRSFLYADESRVVGYAQTPAEAERLVNDFKRRYAKAPVPTGGCFHLVRKESRISTEKVPLGAETMLDPETFGLHYGGEGWTWHQGFTGKLRGSRHGLCVFEGLPGTGKTSYLRHLMGVLKETHRFYFIPPATLSVLSSPDFIGFWAGERSGNDKQQFVVILEDADAALMTRANDNHSQVSAILNLSDGMLADFLRLQIICTVNCRAEEIDPALLRPGRLLCHRVFPRLDAAEARRLAGHLGRRLPPGGGDFSLAEIFAGGEQDVPQRARMGFAASQPRLPVCTESSGNQRDHLPFPLFSP